MQKPLTLGEYLDAPYIAEPLRLYDYCLINDGGGVIIVRRADMAHDLRHRPITVSGFGSSEENVDATQLRPRLKDFYHTAHRDVAAQVYPAGVAPPRGDAAPAPLDGWRGPVRRVQPAHVRSAAVVGDPQASPVSR